MDGAALLADLVGANIDIGGAEIELPTRRLAGLRGGHRRADRRARGDDEDVIAHLAHRHPVGRSEEHTSELESLMRISYGVFCVKKKKNKNIIQRATNEEHNTHIKTTP